LQERVVLGINSDDTSGTSGENWGEVVDSGLGTMQRAATQGKVREMKTLAATLHFGHGDMNATKQLVGKRFSIVQVRSTPTGGFFCAICQKFSRIC
jgi:hypothetical protein